MIILIILSGLFLNLSYLAIGGLYLILGAFYVFTGNIYYSIGTYVFADITWFINALLTHDIFGAVTIFIGTSAGLSAAYKMKTGIFTKTLIKKDIK